MSYYKGSYDYVAVDIDTYHIPKKYHNTMYDIFDSDNNATFKYDEVHDICLYSYWPCCEVWRDIETDEIIKDKGMLVKQLTFSDTKTKKQGKILEPVHTLYGKVVPKKPFDIKVSQKG